MLHIPALGLLIFAFTTDVLCQLFLSGDFEEAYFFLCCSGILIKRVTEITFEKYLFFFAKYQEINA